MRLTRKKDSTTTKTSLELVEDQSLDDVGGGARDRDGQHLPPRMSASALEYATTGEGVARWTNALDPSARDT